jgi:glycosyltransferase involved in cell wall biosynthesis
MRPDNVELALKNVSVQSYKNKELILLLHGEDFDVKKIQEIANKENFPIKVIQRPKESLFGENLNLALDKCTGQFTTKMDDDDYYGPEHLNDLLAAYYFSSADIVGKWSNWTYLTKANLTVSWAIDRQETFGHHLPGATIFMETEMLRKIKFGRVKKSIDSELFRRLEMRGGTLYSTHRYNFVRVRHDSHTYQTDEESFLSHSDNKRYEGYDDSICFI